MSFELFVRFLLFLIDSICCAIPIFSKKEAGFSNAICLKRGVFLATINGTLMSLTEKRLNQVLVSF